MRISGSSTSSTLLIVFLSVTILLSGHFAESRLNPLGDAELEPVFPDDTNNKRNRKKRRTKTHVKGEQRKRKLDGDGYGDNDCDNRHPKSPSCCPEDALGSIWSSLILGVSRNPSLKDEMFKLAIAGSSVVLAGEDINKIDDFATSYALEFLGRPPIFGGRGGLFDSQNGEEVGEEVGEEDTSP